MNGCLGQSLEKGRRERVTEEEAIFNGRQSPKKKRAPTDGSEQESIVKAIAQERVQ